MGIAVSTPSVRTTLLRYCSSLSAPLRRRTKEVAVGDVPLGGTHPIRLQSMTTTDTMDVAGTVAQALRLAAAGSEYVRLTVPSQREAQQLPAIKKALHAAGSRVPLVADIHFTPKAAEIAARHVEKVRINPGNYADKKRFEQINYSEASYAIELDRIAARFAPLVKICKEEGCAMRIGTNHGSLSDRIMSRYGDTPLGMVESALEFLRICHDFSYHDVVLSMKASQPQIMIGAYRLLVQRLEEEQLGNYPLHLGVTEAGDGEDGRLKSALGIGTLLSEGLGDTIRVSLTEAPERELPVAAALRDRYGLSRFFSEKRLPAEVAPACFSPFEHSRRTTCRVLDWGGGQLPRVVVDASQAAFGAELLAVLGYRYLPELDKWESREQAADYVYTGRRGEQVNLPRGLRQLLHYSSWQRCEAPGGRYPLFLASEAGELAALPAQVPAFVLATTKEVTDLRPLLSNRPQSVLLLHLSATQGYIDLRRACFEAAELQVPMGFFMSTAPEEDKEALLLRAAVELGGCFADGFGDGLCLSATDLNSAREITFGVLQAARLRLSKTEYIACPSCGRTLFDLEETTARIRMRTSHLKGLKIGIMGCIVNGPGEMADADYGYVGAGKDRITLYKGKDIMRRNVPTAEAVDALIALIQADGKWQDPPQN